MMTTSPSARPVTTSVTVSFASPNVAAVSTTSPSFSTCTPRWPLTVRIVVFGTVRTFCLLARITDADALMPALMPDAGTSTAMSMPYTGTPDWIVATGSSETTRPVIL